MKQAADAAIREKAAQEGKPAPQPPPDNEEGQKPLPPAPVTPPKETPPAAGPDVNLAAHIKEKYGIDISEDELVSRLTSGNGNGKPSVSAKKKSGPPKPEDITDEALETFLDQNKKKDLLEKNAANKKLDDLKLLEGVYVNQLKELYPGIEDDYATRLFHERFFIPEKGEDDVYTDDEKKYGQHLLKQEADRLRNQIGYQIDGARDLLYQKAVEDYNNELYAEQVDEFMRGQPKQMKIDLGKSGNIDLGDYPINLEDDTVKQVRDIMASPMRLLDEFRDRDKDGNLSEELNLQKMYDFFIKAKLFDQVLKSTAVDYYSKGFETVSNKLHNSPDLSRLKTAEPKKNTKKEEQEKAEQFNAEQIGRNMGRGRIR